jgi:uncharacterized FAD-dependent dehydrogenase
MRIFGPDSNVQIGTDAFPVGVKSITGHVFSKDEAELHIKTSVGDLTLELNQSEVQHLFHEVNRMTELFPD